MKNYCRIIIAALSLFSASIATAAIPNWQIVPAKSSIGFTATQNDAPVKGQFTNFNGTISFDPNQLPNSKVTFTVNLNNIKASYAEIADTLKTAQWFDAAKFPQATFTATDFTKTGNNTYQARGNLTLHGKTLPVTLNFTLEQYTPTQATVKGTTTLSRTEFGVGQGEWSNTKSIKDNVEIDFVLNAVSKA